MARSSYIAREGWLYIGAAILVAAAIQFLVGELWAIVLWLAVLGLIFLFRDPVRSVPPAPLAIVSPADGEVILVDSVNDPYLDRAALRIRIRADFFTVYSRRSPVGARVERVWCPLLCIPDDPAAEGLCTQEGFAVLLKTDEDDKVIVQLYGRGLRRPRCHALVGERMGQGQRCGVAPFGGCVELLAPANARICVKPGDRVQAGSSIMAKLVHN